MRMFCAKIQENICVNAKKAVFLQRKKLVIMTNKELYADWVKTQEMLPIFYEPWWLDAVCAGRSWDVLLVKEGEEILAALPYMLCKKWWLRWIDMPQQTQLGGLWLDGNRSYELAELQHIRDSIAEQLDAMKLAYYYQHFPAGSPCATFLVEKGFKAKERITYRIDDVSDLDAVIDRFSKNKKRQLQKSLSLHAERDMTAEEFYQFHLNCLSGRGKRLSYSREFLLVLEQKLRKHKRCQILSVCNADHVPYAAVLLVWDKRRVYYLMPCYNSDYSESGAGALLVLESIKFCRELGLSFDFEGSMLSGVAKHYKQFGPTATTYYSVEKYYKWWFRFVRFFSWLKNRKYK